MSSDDASENQAVKAMLDWNAQIVDEFRANKGKVGGPFEGAPMLLLHTVGAKSGTDRVSPMMYLNEADRVYVFASKAGADTHPAWYHNLVADSQVTVEMGTQTVAATAVPVSGGERDRLYAIQAEQYPGFAEYEAKTTRVIPVVEIVLP